MFKLFSKKKKEQPIAATQNLQTSQSTQGTQNPQTPLNQPTQTNGIRHAGDVKPVCLIILDGYGNAPASKGNAITLAKKPFIDSLYANYPVGELIAAGESVGLPANEVGNTEVGHLTLGAGRVIFQSLERINRAIENGLFFQNKAFLEVLEHVRKNNSRLHLLGLTGSGNVHSSINHLYALLKFCKQRELSNVFVHAITDGRDSPPNDGINVITKLDKYLKDNNLGQIASVMGRYYAMDRDKRWDRIEKAYKAYVLGRGNMAPTAEQAIQTSYANGKTDEFIEPTLVAQNGKPVGLISDNDAVIFFNFRIDRPRELTMAFTMPNFETLKSFDFGYLPDTKRMEGEVDIKRTFQREKVLKNLFFVTMTEYQKNIPVSAVAFGEPDVPNCLPEVIANANLRQFHLAESEKERFVTYYFDGMTDNRYKNEDVLIIPSPKVSTYDKKPEMSAFKIADAFVDAIDKGIYSFVLTNLANPDMVAHTGNLKKTIKAIEDVDKVLSKMVPKVLSKGGTVLITADHGNAEELLTFSGESFFFTTKTGDRNTDHSNNPVPLFLVGDQFKNQKINIPKGALSDVAPTILGIMKIAIPPEMKGKDLLAPPKNENTNDGFEIYY